MRRVVIGLEQCRHPGQPQRLGLGVQVTERVEPVDRGGQQLDRFGDPPVPRRDVAEQHRCPGRGHLVTEGFRESCGLVRIGAALHESPQLTARLGPSEQVDHPYRPVGVSVAQLQRVGPQALGKEPRRGLLGPGRRLAEPEERTLIDVGSDLGLTTELVHEPRRLGVVPRQRLHEPVVDLPTADHLVEVGGDAEVTLEPIELGQPRVRDLADEVGAERPLTIVEREDLLGRQRPREVGDIGVASRVARDLVQGVHGTGRPPDRGILQRVLLGRRETVDARRDETAEGVGELGQPARRRRGCTLGEEGDELLQVEGVATAAVEQHLAQRLGQLLGQQLVEQIGSSGTIERVEVEHGRVVPPRFG